MGRLILHKKYQGLIDGNTYFFINVMIDSIKKGRKNYIVSVIEEENDERYPSYNFKYRTDSILKVKKLLIRDLEKAYEKDVGEYNKIQLILD